MSHEYDLLSIHDFIFNKILPKFGSYDRKQLLSKYFDSSNYLCSYYENLINFLMMKTILIQLINLMIA